MPAPYRVRSDLVGRLAHARGGEDVAAHVGRTEVAEDVLPAEVSAEHPPAPVGLGLRLIAYPVVQVRVCVRRNRDQRAARRFAAKVGHFGASTVEKTWQHMPGGRNAPTASSLRPR